MQIYRYIKMIQLVVLLLSVTSGANAQSSLAHYCVNDLHEYGIQVEGSNLPPGYIVNWTVEIDEGPGVIGLSPNPSGPFSNSIIVPMVIQTNSWGQSYYHLKAMMVGNAHRSLCSEEFGCLFGPAPHFYKVNTVNSVELIAMNSPLDSNPNSGGGLRIYPDKQFPSDATDRKKVKVRANTSLAGGKVNFRSFDIDDPSTSAVIDPNGLVGDDNRGTPQSGSLGTATSATADANGVAEIEFEVTMRAGDNFKVAASCNDTTVQYVDVDGMNLKDRFGNTLPTDQAKVTEMLTVWRKLHIEVDSMGLVAGNQVLGTVKAAKANSKNNTTTLSVNTNPNLEQDRFQNGKIDIASVGVFTVLSNGTNSLTVQGLVNEKLAPGKSFSLVDDDDFNSNNGTNKTGDEGENIFAPDLALIADSLDNGICDNSAANAFGPAYVCPVFDLAGNGDLVPFVLNVPTNTAPALQAIYNFDNVATEGDPEFWTVYLLNAYQFVVNEDDDPNSEAATLGVSDSVQGAVVFVETVKENSAQGPNCTLAAAAVHELGHVMGPLHADGGIMAECGLSGTISFTDQSIDRIRDRVNTNIGP